MLASCGLIFSVAGMYSSKNLQTVIIVIDDDNAAERETEQQGACADSATNKERLAEWAAMDVPNPLLLISERNSSQQENSEDRSTGQNKNIPNQSSNCKNFKCQSDTSLFKTLAEYKVHCEEKGKKTHGFICKKCSRENIYYSCGTKRGLIFHKQSIHLNIKYPCTAPECVKVFTLRSNAAKHIDRCHSKNAAELKKMLSAVIPEK